MHSYFRRWRGQIDSFTFGLEKKSFVAWSKFPPVLFGSGATGQIGRSLSNSWHTLNVVVVVVAALPLAGLAGCTDALDHHIEILAILTVIIYIFRFRSTYRYKNLDTSQTDTKNGLGGLEISLHVPYM